MSPLKWNMNHNENVVLLGESQKWSNWRQLTQKVWIWMSFCSSRKLLMQIPSKSQTQTKVHFVLNLTAPSYYFKITGSENTKITGVISEKINCSMCNCRLIACPLPSEARAIVYSLSHDERPSVVVQENLLKPLFCKWHYRLQSHHDQKHVGGSKEVLCQAK